jgi:hypothetical protein
MSYCYICGSPTPGSFGKCQACVERLAKEELEKETQYHLQERRVRLRILLKVTIVLLIFAGIGVALFIRILYRKEGDLFIAKQETIISPYLAALTGDRATGPDFRSGGHPGDGKVSSVSKNFTSGDQFLVILKSKGIDCAFDSREPEGIILGNEVMYLKCDGEAAALYIFSDVRKATEGIKELNDSKKYGLIDQIGNTVFVTVSGNASVLFDRVRMAFAS